MSGRQPDLPGKVIGQVSQTCNDTATKKLFWSHGLKTLESTKWSAYDKSAHDCMATHSFRMVKPGYRRYARYVDGDTVVLTIRLIITFSEISSSAILMMFYCGWRWAQLPRQHRKRANGGSSWTPPDRRNNSGGCKAKWLRKSNIAPTIEIRPGYRQCHGQQKIWRLITHTKLQITKG